MKNYIFIDFFQMSIEKVTNKCVSKDFVSNAEHSEFKKQK